MLCKIIIILQYILLVLHKASGEEFNLFGEAGQAYAIEINIGHPHQKLNLIVDTGSSTLAVAAYPRHAGDKYFNYTFSSSLYDRGEKTEAKYSQGDWVGQLVTDFVQIPSLPSVPEVRSDIALITKSHKFFTNGSGWQGLLGLAYIPVAAWSYHVIPESWLDYADQISNMPLSFQMKLCGVQSVTNSTHYGHFHVFSDIKANRNHNRTFRTPVLRKGWYEVGVLSIKVGSKKSNDKGNVSRNNDFINDRKENPNVDVCRQLNEDKSIIDSGTTNIRLPDTLFRQLVDELKDAAQNSNMLILDEYWYHGEAACWPEPQQWALPWLKIDLLSADNDHQYFTVEIPPQNYMRVVSAHNSSNEGGTVSEFCYKLGLEAGGKDTILGYTAMEGLQLLFNRSAGWIDWQTSDCGPNAHITGPYNASTSLIELCDLTKLGSDPIVSIKAAQWSLCAISIIAAGVLVYLLGPCLKTLFLKRVTRTQQISLSQAFLVEQESS